MLEKVKVSQVQLFYHNLVKEVLINKLAIKQELQDITLKHLIDALVLNNAGNELQNKALAIFNLLFINKDGISEKGKGSQLQILDDNANQKTLFE